MNPPPAYQLFGGTITASLPPNLVDAADLRQIPDTQEVLLAPNSDTSFIFDIVQCVDPQDLSKALEFHFDSVAHDNDAASFEIFRLSPAEAVSALDGHPLPSTVYGRQRISKFRKDNSDENLDLVDIYLALWRIPSKNVDFVLSMNVPRGNAAVLTQAQGATDEEPLAEKEQFETAVRSLRIQDYGLFVDPS